MDNGGTQEVVLGTDPRYAHWKPNPKGKPTPTMVFAQTQTVIATTPIPKLDMARLGVNPGTTPLERVPCVDVVECVGCNLCALVCPVEDCIDNAAAREWVGVGELGGAGEGAARDGFVEGRLTAIGSGGSL